MTNITIRELKAEDLDEYFRFLTENFYCDEPLQLTPGDHNFEPDTPERRASRLAVIKQGLSLVAVDSNDGGRIVASAYSEAKVPDDLEKTWREVNEKKPTEFIEHVDLFLAGFDKRSKLFERFEVSKVFCLNILGVGKTVRQQGLGRRLVSAVIELARSKGFPLIAVSCTSLYSTRIMSALGMSCIHSEKCSDYKDEDGNVVLKPPEPHTSINLMAMKL
ncbi:arylalkylamine N-acetyltransferase-like 2 [Drosophila sulfurigaster albostrigata]|uniref:arylalkylamine N-acetyltransferase-like 2 n=1 Tax=Drosophila sulfurigaster albostrigata TaxID=89887 RepID=UPI002D21A027|nr:arylalkylamine N-acetyltransferase-like 2 [Drosophila sulfurigaster albostrigata]